jgi:hypothetical protein
MLKSVALLAIGGVAACGGSSAQSPDGGADAPPGVATRTVTGHDIAHFVTPAGITDVPLDLSMAPVKVLVPPAFTPISGIGHSDGTFEIPNVPVGDYYFDAGSHYYVMSGDSIDLDFYEVGRPDNSVATSATNLTFNLTDLDPWQDGDQIELYSPQTGTLAFGMTDAATSGAPMVDDTALTGMVYDLRNADRRALISSSDIATIYQLSLATDGARDYHSITRAYAAAPFSIANGGSATITGAFTTLAPSQTLTATWDRPAFAADVAAHFPHAAPTSLSTFGLTALTGAGEHGYYDEGPDLLYFAPGYTTDTTAVTASWPYADPYPGTWGRVLWNRFYGYREIALPGADSTAIFARLLTYRDLSTVAADPMFEPGVGLVVNPTISGSDALAVTSLTGIGTTPTIAWQPPTIGTPSKYYVAVYAVSNVSGTTTLKEVALFETAATQLAIPPNVLVAGKPYVFEIRVRATTVDLVEHPSAYALPDALSAVMTTMATP